MTSYDPLFAVAQPFAHLRNKELERQLAVEKTKTAITKLVDWFVKGWYPYLCEFAAKHGTDRKSVV